MLKITDDPLLVMRMDGSIMHEIIRVVATITCTNLRYLWIVTFLWYTIVRHVQIMVSRHVRQSCELGSLYTVSRRQTNLRASRLSMSDYNRWGYCPHCSRKSASNFVHEAMITGLVAN